MSLSLRVFGLGLFVNLLLVTGVYAADKATILVGGATGRQGNAVVEELLERGYTVRGMTRKPESKGGKALAALGVEVVQGDYSDPESLLAAMEGVDKLFFYSGFSMNEVVEGQNVTDAAKASGISQVVYSSGAAAEPGVGIDGAAKEQVELALLERGLS